MNVGSIWPFAQISDDFCYLGIWQCSRYFVAASFKELALITIKEMWGLESRSRPRTSRSRLLWQSLGLISKFEPGLGLGVGLGGYGLDYITGILYQRLWYLILIPYLSKLRATFFGIWRICTKCKACLSSTDNLWGRQISANNRTLIFNFSNFPHNPQTNILYHRLWYFIQIPHL